MEDSLLHSAQRLLRFMKIDEERGGGLISIDTIKAGELLRQEIIKEEKRNAASGGPSEVPDGNV